MNTKILCLAALSLGKASGYDIGKKLEDPFGHFVDVARSGVYPVLKSLEEEGLVQSEIVEQEALPNKKIYDLTDAGRDFLKAELEVLVPTHKIRSQFMFLLFFAEMLSPERLETIFEERIKDMECFLRDEPRWREYVSGNKGQEFLLEYVHDKVKAEKEFLEKNAEMLIEGLKNKEVAGETAEEMSYE
ncbi:MAG: PadR family transcriptional regulator [Pseudohongiellaceae bacterium]